MSPKIYKKVPHLTWDEILAMRRTPQAKKGIIHIPSKTKQNERENKKTREQKGTKENKQKEEKTKHIVY